MSSVLHYLKLTWAGNFTRYCSRTVCCEQRQRWTENTKRRVRESTDGKCFYCRIKLDSAGPRTMMHIDHYWPWSKGGANLIENLVPACARCNLAKSNRLASTFIVRNKLYTNPYCRHLTNGKFCSERPRNGRKYCFRHTFTCR